MRSAIFQVDSLMPGGAMMSFVLTIITYMPANVLFAYFVSFMFDKWDTAQSAMPIMFFMVIIASTARDSQSASRTK